MGNALGYTCDNPCLGFMSHSLPPPHGLVDHRESRLLKGQESTHNLGASPLKSDGNWKLRTPSDIVIFPTHCWQIEQINQSSQHHRAAHPLWAALTYWNVLSLQNRAMSGWHFHQLILILPISLTKSFFNMTDLGYFKREVPFSFDPLLLLPFL